LVADQPVLLEARGVHKHFAVVRGVLLARRVGVIRAVDGVDFEVRAGETLALVGESGCGKSTLGHLVLRLVPPTAGRLTFNGQPLADLRGEPLGRFRRQVQAVLQDPYASLSPRMRIADIVAEPLVASGAADRGETRVRVAEALGQVGLDGAVHGARFPHQFSGGQRQRIAIARALVSRPRLIVMDEPVSALDVSVRGQILNLLAELQDRLGVAYLLISHDLDGVRYLSHRVAVMYLGRLVEAAPAEELFDRPLHPYTQALLAAALPLDPQAPVPPPLPGEVPSALDPPGGCAFHPRCPSAMDICRSTVPRPREEGRRWVACHLYGPGLEVRPEPAGPSALDPVR
jgi:oligopeptide transport system ATP-binding protein